MYVTVLVILLFVGKSQRFLELLSVRPRRNVLADIFDHIADNFDRLADKKVHEKIPTWLNDMLCGKVCPQLYQLMIYISGILSQGGP